MAMMVMTRREHADQVDRQSHRADDEQLIRVHLGRIDQTLNSFEDNEDRDEDEEDAVGEAGEELNPTEAMRQGSAGKVKIRGP